MKNLNEKERKKLENKQARYAVYAWLIMTSWAFHSAQSENKNIAEINQLSTESKQICIV